MSEMDIRALEEAADRYYSSFNSHVRSAFWHRENFGGDVNGKKNAAYSRSQGVQQHCCDYAKNQSKP